MPCVRLEAADGGAAVRPDDAVDALRVVAERGQALLQLLRLGARRASGRRAASARAISGAPSMRAGQQRHRQRVRGRVVVALDHAEVRIGGEGGAAGAGGQQDLDAVGRRQRAVASARTPRACHSAALERRVSSASA